MKTLKLYRSTKSNWLTQGFGDNKACCRVDADGNPLRPFIVVGKIPSGNKMVCPPNSVDFYKQGLGLEGHNGKDWLVITGEVVYWSGDFEGVVYNEVDSSGGLGVRVYSKEKLKLQDGSEQYVCVGYWHLKKFYRKDGETVKFGDSLGEANCTGACSGAHVHEFLKIVDEYRNTYNTDNGYHGAINQDPYFENTFVLDILVERQKPKTNEETKKLLNEVQEQIDRISNSNLPFKESLLVTIQRYIKVVVEWLRSIIKSNNVGTMSESHPAPKVFSYSSSTGNGDLALRYKAMMLGFVPVVITIAGIFGLPLVESDVVKSINDIFIGLSGVGFIWGTVRPYLRWK